MLFIRERLVDEILAEARTAAGREVCGILAGKDGKVEKVYKMTNASDRPESCYFMDPKEQFKVQKEMRAEGMEMLAIYHSHPSSDAYPSARDVELAFYPEATYVIVSLKDPNRAEIRAFRIIEGKIKAEEINYEDR